MRSKVEKSFPCIEAFDCDQYADDYLRELQNKFSTEIVASKVACNDNSVWYVFYTGSMPDVKEICLLFSKIVYRQKVVPLIEKLEIHFV